MQAISTALRWVVPTHRPARKIVEIGLTRQERIGIIRPNYLSLRHRQGGRTQASSETSFGTETVFRGSGARGRLDIVDKKRRFFTRLGKEEMMRKATLSLIPAFVVAFSVSAFAQAERDVKTGGAGREETLKVTINGGWDVVWAHFERDAADIITFGGQPFPQSFMTGRLYLDLHASLQDNVDIHVRIQNLNNTGFPFRALGSPNLDATDGGQIVPLGMTDPFSLLELDEVYASIREIIDPAVTLTVGLQTYVWDPTGSGTPMLLALGRSEPLWPKVRNTNIPMGASRAEAGFAGARIDYAREKFALTVGFFQTNTIGASLGIEGKERVFFVNASFDVTEDGSRVGVIAALFNGDGTGGGNGKKDQILTLGGGARVRVGTDINVFGEVYVQSGSASDLFSVDAAGLMFRVGGHIAFPGSTPAWVEVSYISVSGDDPTDGGKDANFYSYENDDDMVMFSSSEWGIDLDDNYVMIKIKAGVSLSTGGGTNNLRLIGKVALVSVHDDTGFPDDSWGMEVNATLEYLFNKNVKVYVTVAHMSGGDIQEAFSARAVDSGLMFLIGTAGEF